MPVPRTGDGATAVDERGSPTFGPAAYSMLPAEAWRRVVAQDHQRCGSGLCAPVRQVRAARSRTAEPARPGINADPAVPAPGGTTSRWSPDPSPARSTGSCGASATTSSSIRGAPSPTRTSSAPGANVAVLLNHLTFGNHLGLYFISTAAVAALCAAIAYSMVPRNGLSFLVLWAAFTIAPSILIAFVSPVFEFDVLATALAVASVVVRESKPDAAGGRRPPQRHSPRRPPTCEHLGGGLLGRWATTGCGPWRSRSLSSPTQAVGVWESASAGPTPPRGWAR